MRCVRVFFVLYAVSSYPTDFWVSIYSLYTSSTLALASVVLPHHFGNQ
jgi:hypothetical protein